MNVYSLPESRLLFSALPVRGYARANPDSDGAGEPAWHEQEPGEPMNQYTPPPVLPHGPVGRMSPADNPAAAAQAGGLDSRALERAAWRGAAIGAAVASAALLATATFLLRFQLAPARCRALCHDLCPGHCGDACTHDAQEPASHRRSAHRGCRSPAGQHP